MPCYQSTSLPSGVTTTGRTAYTTEAECLQACKEGACCEGTTCSVKPQCQCQGTGKTFKGVGTTCSQPSIGSITATIQTQDYLTQRRATNTTYTGRIHYEDASVGLVGAFYNGTFALSSAAASGQLPARWEYTFQPQRSGTCVGSVQLWSNGSVWTIRFTYSVVSWVIYPYATAASCQGCQFNYVVDTSAAAFATYMVPGNSQTFRVPRYKELSDMQCVESGIWPAGAPGFDSFAGYPLSTGPTRTETWSATSCELFGTSPWSKTFQPVFPPSTSVLRQEGTNSLTLSLSVSSNPLP
jgi:hypothetical protein